MGIEFEDGNEHEDLRCLFANKANFRPFSTLICIFVVASQYIKFCQDLRSTLLFRKFCQGFRGTLLF